MNNIIEHLFQPCRNVFPDNMIKATFSQSQTENKISFQTIERNTTNGTISEVVQTISKSVKDAGGTNVLGK